ncbi:ABC transporter ATP-binding protein [Nocardia sp. CNY236]|uniref:ABC transporter ATP-binding protein n=1 Tax=Nocardia sp. CNY236 TaxID=1169152 RepID=UPI0004203CE0|nr:ATP-binding cassette domain-containing protein [Nocardia sp. CNY236]
MRTELTVDGGTKQFGDTVVLDSVCLSIDRGEFLAVLGPSGSGKSTLLRVLAGLAELTAGTVRCSADGERPRTGVVFQQSLLLPWLTVLENVSLAGRFAAHRDVFDREYPLTLLRRFGLDGLAGRYPNELSGGQAQRVAVLRAAATRPRLLLLDEPFSALDPATRIDSRQWLSELVAELGATVVLITHDVDEAVALADRIVLLDRGRIRRGWRDVRSGDALALRDDILQQYHPDEMAVP